MTKNYANYYFYYHFIRNIIINGGDMTRNPLHNTQMVKFYQKNSSDYKRYEKFGFYAKQFRDRRKRLFLYWSKQVRNAWTLYRTGRRVHKDFWKRYNKKIYLRNKAKMKYKIFKRELWGAWSKLRRYPVRQMLKGRTALKKVLRKKIILKARSQGRRVSRLIKRLKKLKFRKNKRKYQIRRKIKQAKKLTKSTKQHLQLVNITNAHNRTVSNYRSEAEVDDIKSFKISNYHKQSSMRILAAYKKWRRVGEGTRKKTKPILYSYFKYVPGSARPFTEEEKAEIQRRRDAEKEAAKLAAAAGGDNKKPPTDEGTEK